MRLLLLDSPPEVEQLASALAEIGGVEPVVEGDLEGALGRLRSNAIDGVVLATSFTGDTASVREILRYCESGNPPVLLVADTADEIASYDGAMGSAIDDFVLKPIDLATLRTRVDLMHRRRGSSSPVRSNARLHEEAQVKRAYTSRVISAQEAERQHLSRELHDGIGQMLLVHRMDAEWLANQIEPGPLRDEAERMCSSLDRTLESVRNLAMDLRPPAIDDLGIASALETLVANIARRSGIDCEAEIQPSITGVSANVSVAVYRIAQEALANAVNHARCENITVSLTRSKRDLQLKVVDDGVGFDPAAENGPSWLGLVGMRERAEVVGGRVTIESGANQGTCVKVIVADVFASPTE